LRLSGAPFALDFVTVRLQPQMKKYRCPWYVSTTNHNILYFVGISRTCSLNTAICLWKVANGPVWRGVARSVLRWNRGKPDRKPGPAPIPVPPSKRSPSPALSQGAELVQNGASPVRIVDKREAGPGLLFPLGFKPGRGGQHPLVQDADDANPSSHNAIEHYVLLNLIPAQPRLN